MSETEQQGENSENLPAVQQRVELGILRASDAKQMTATATSIAEALAEVIAKQKLFVEIQGRKYVRCEGWTTLAAMMGVTPQEEDCVRHEDGGYEATVRLVRLSDGAVVGRASALCGMDEVWADRNEYARKSMAATRATGKACRLAFSWIMALAGFESTPAEEMPKHRPATEKQRKLIYGRAKARGLNDDQLHALYQRVTGKESSNDLTMDDIDPLLAAIDGWSESSDHAIGMVMTQHNLDADLAEDEKARKHDEIPF